MGQGRCKMNLAKEIFSGHATISTMQAQPLLLGASHSWLGCEIID
jgi:hypothetical protein